MNACSSLLHAILVASCHVPSPCPFCTVSWTLYGLVTSNLGKQENLLQLNNGQIVTVPEFLYNNFHYQHDMVGYIVLILAAFVTAFWTAGWAAFRYLNFNVRPCLLGLGGPECGCCVGCHDMNWQAHLHIEVVGSWLQDGALCAEAVNMSLEDQHPQWTCLAPGVGACGCTSTLGYLCVVRAWA